MSVLSSGLMGSFRQLNPYTRFTGGYSSLDPATGPRQQADQAQQQQAYHAAHPNYHGFQPNPDGTIGTRTESPLAGAVQAGGTLPAPSDVQQFGQPGSKMQALLAALRNQRT